VTLLQASRSCHGTGTSPMCRPNPRHLARVAQWRRKGARALPHATRGNRPMASLTRAWGSG